MYFNTSYNRQEFLRIFQTKICPNFIKEERSLHITRKTAYFVDNGIFKLGTVKLDKEITVLEIQQKSSKDPRITLTKDAFKVLSDYGIDNAVIIFYGKDNTSYRLSLLTVSYADWNNKKTSSYKRYSYILGPVEKTKTAEKQLLHPVKDYDDLVSRFDVEVVRQDFFEKYLELYVRLYKEIKRDNDFTSLLSSQNVDIVSFTKNLLGKIVFLYFIQQKGWLGLGHKEKEYGKGNKNFMRIMRDNFSKSHESMSTEKTGYFYNDYLERLFFAGLNIDRRDNDDWFPNLQMKVPYLNGGLFKEDYQGREKYVTKISNDIFSNVDTKGDDADGILDIFDRYNFTVDEDSLYDSDIAVDPEMLGRIFEKMISISNDNIDEVIELYDNKGKKAKIDFGKELNKKLGAFYTPREIVHYMTKESLIAYLVNNIKGDKQEVEALIRDLFELKEQFLLHQEDLKKVGFGENTLDNLSKIIDQIDEALKKVKILDPAVGSGAFPMGLLHEISSIRYYMYGVFHSVFGDKTKQYKNKENKLSMYQIKREIILNNIYGVDIDPGAIDIARLRFWLSLVVDEEQPEPLPNFEFKFVCANTLIPLEEETKERDLFAQGDEPKLETLKKYKSEYYNASSNKEKIQLKERIREYTKVDTTLFSEPTPRAKQMAEFGANFDNNKHSHSFFDPSLMMSERRGFDIVIGNPPYIGYKGNANLFEAIKRTKLGEKYHHKEMDYRYYFCHLGIDLLKINGIIGFITTNYRKTAYGASKLREVIKENSLIMLLDFGDNKIFENAEGQHNNIFMIKKKTVQGGIKIFKSNLVSLGNIFDKDNIITYENNCFDENNNIYFNNQENSDILNLIKKHKTLIGDNFKVGSGIKTGSDFVSDEHIKKYNIKNIYKGEGIFVLKEEEYEDLLGKGLNPQLLGDFYKSSDIDKFKTNKNKYKLLLALDKEDLINNKIVFEHLNKYKDILINRKSGFGKLLGRLDLNFSKDNTKLYSQYKKIVTPYRSNTNKFAYIEKELYTAEDVYFIYNANGSDHLLKYLTILLNSNLYLFYFQHASKIKGKVMEFTSGVLKKIPFKMPIGNEEEVIINLFDKITDCPNKRTEINQMVYKLYGLTEEEIKVVEESVK